MKGRILDWVIKNFGITPKEWIGLLAGFVLLILPFICLIPDEFSLWSKAYAILLVGGWIAVVLYLLLVVTKTVREQDREDELVASIQDYLGKALQDIEWTNETADMVSEELREWKSLPKEIKYKRDKL